MSSCKTNLMIFWLIFACVFIKPIFSYKWLLPTIEVLKPKGLRVSIPDTRGLKTFHFHGNVNKVFHIKYEDIGGIVSSMTNGRWIFEDLKVTIKDRDIIYYKICVFIRAKQYPYCRIDSWMYFSKENQEISSQKITLSSTPKYETPITSRLLLEDNFNYLNTSLWKREIKIPLKPDYEFCVYGNKYHQQLVRIRKGQLNIKPILLENFYGEQMTMKGTLYLNNCTSTIVEECSRKALSYNILPPVISARLTTKERFFLRYGRIEIRAKFPQGDWLYPEMWLEPKFSSTNVAANYVSGRVLLGMARGNKNLVNATDVSKIYDDRRLDFSVRVGTSPNIQEIIVSKLHEFGPRWTQDFHVYTTIWTSDGFTFLVDDEEIGRVKPDKWLSDLNANRKNAPFDQEFYITLGVGVGGVRVFPDNTISSGSPKPWNNMAAKALLNFWNSRNEWLPTWRRNRGQKTAFKIDYIKVWSD